MTDEIVLKGTRNIKVTLGTAGETGTNKHNKLKNLGFDDSGHTGFQKELEYDEHPIIGSENSVTSGAVATALAANGAGIKERSYEEIDDITESGVYALTYAIFSNEISTVTHLIVQQTSFGITQFLFKGIISTVDITDLILDKIPFEFRYKTGSNWSEWKTFSLGDSKTFAKKNVNNNFSASQTINGTLTVNGDIVQNGETYTTHAEDVYTKQNIIHTREGAVGGLSAGEYTGLEAEKYDGENNGQLVFSADGTARVGDAGDTQPLLTRQEEVLLADGAVLEWDADGRKAVGSQAYAKTEYVNAVSGLFKSVDEAYSSSVLLNTNTMTNIAVLSGAISITLQSGVRGFDNEWAFTVKQGANAYDVILPEISWGLGIAPVFAANSTTMCRLYYVGEALCGEWVSV